MSSAQRAKHGERRIRRNKHAARHLLKDYRDRSEHKHKNEAHTPEPMPARNSSANAECSARGCTVPGGVLRTMLHGTSRDADAGAVPGQPAHNVAWHVAG